MLTSRNPPNPRRREVEAVVARAVAAIFALHIGLLWLRVAVVLGVDGIIKRVLLGFVAVLLTEVVVALLHRFVV